jgi:Family of unknown function (DUF6381)
LAAVTDLVLVLAILFP